MNFKKICICSIIFSIGSFGFASADNTPPAEQEITVPAPLHLNSHWWDYFSVEGEPYQKRSEDFFQNLQEQLSQLDKEQKESAAVLVKRLIGNVKALSVLRAEKIETPHYKPFNDSYTLTQEIELAKQIANSRTNLQNEKKEEKFLSNRNSKVSSHLDKLMITYRESEDETFQKYLLGLEIINSRLTLAINEEKLRAVRERLENLNQTIKRYEEELRYAQNHSNLSGISIGEINNELKEVQGKLEIAKNNSLIAELKAQPIYDNSLSGKMKGSLQQLFEYQLSIKELSAELSILFQEAKLLIGKLYQNEYEGSKEELNSAYKQLSAQLNSIKAQTKQWEQRNDEEFSRFDKIVENDDENSEEIEKLGGQRTKVIQENRVLLNQVDEKLFTTEFVLGQLDQMIMSRQSPLAQYWNYSIDKVYNCCEGVLAWYDRTLFKVGEQPVTTRDVFKGLAVIAIAYILSIIIRRLIAKGFKKRHLSHGFVYSINRLIHYSIMLVGFIFALSSVGLDFDRIYLVIGALGVGIGFGLQGIVNNFVSGLIILFTRNFKVGDIIDIESGGCGSVSAINVQNTIIRSFDGVDIVVPNSSLISSKFVNWTRKDPYKRFRIRFCVEFGADKDKVVEVVSKAAQNVPATAGQANGVPDPGCWMTEIGDNGLVFDLVVWANMFKSGNHGSIGTSYVWEVESALRENGFKIPYPSRQIYTQPE